MTAARTTTEVRTGTRPRLYPMPAPGDDPRFTFGLLIDVLDVLQTHGYPRPAAGGDLIELQQALFGFLYDTTRREASNP
jgi:hypothetical protein